MNEETLQVVMAVIMHSGNAKGQVFEAIQLAKKGQFEEVDKAMQQANEELKEAHNVQTSLLTKEANGEPTELNLYVIHAQDHLMTSIIYKDLAVEIIELEKRLQQVEEK